MAEPTASLEPHPQAALDTSVRARPASALGPRGQLGMEEAVGAGQPHSRGSGNGRPRSSSPLPHLAAVRSKADRRGSPGEQTLECREGKRQHYWQHYCRAQSSQSSLCRGTTSLDRAEQHPSSAYRAGPLASTVWQTLPASRARAAVLIFNRASYRGPSVSSVL